MNTSRRRASSEPNTRAGSTNPRDYDGGRAAAARPKRVVESYVRARKEIGGRRDGTACRRTVTWRLCRRGESVRVRAVRAHASEDPHDVSCFSSIGLRFTPTLAGADFLTKRYSPNEIHSDFVSYTCLLHVSTRYTQVYYVPAVSRLTLFYSLCFYFFFFHKHYTPAV